CHKCYRVIYSIDCESCHNVSFSKNCVGCSDCIGCVNLRNKQYYIFNKPHTKEEFEQLAKEYAPNSRAKIEEIKTKTLALWQAYPQKFIHERLTSNVSGEYIYNSKNVHGSFLVHDMEDSRYCAIVMPGKTTNAYDHTHYGGATDLLYETLQVGNQASHIIGSWFVLINVQNIEYSIFGIGVKNCFGTVGLKKREYCILNKQYTKEEYEKVRVTIIAQMNAMPYKDKNGCVYRYGEFFPIEKSPFGYNAVDVVEITPLSESEILARGYRFKKAEKSVYHPTIISADIPNSADQIPVTICDEILECAHKGMCNEKCSTAFKITPTELQLYQRLALPLPEFCPNCRHAHRLLLRNPFRLWNRRCNCSGMKSENGLYQNTTTHLHNTSHCLNEFETSYSPDRTEIVYCETCYQNEVV
ncbi:MAG: hypothetical protein AAB649_01350, partial [Patescibacteria group bacterium]